MSVRVIAILNPFKEERTEKIVEAASLEEIYKSLSPLLSIDHAFFQINDEPVKDISHVPRDGDVVIIRVLPSGANPAENVQTSGKVAGRIGVLTAIIGAVLIATGVGAVLGGILFSCGISAAIYGFTIAGLSNQLAAQGEIEEKPKADPQIRGSKNSAKPWGAIPIVLGKHLITPPFAAKPFTDITENKQYLRQLFAIGFNQLNITDMKIGDTLITHYTEVQTEIIGDGRLSSFVPNPVNETSINQQLKYNEPVIKTTPSETDQISVDIVLPNGLTKFNDKGESGSYSIVIEVYFKPTDALDSQYQILGLFGDNSSTITGNVTTTIRKVITRSILPGESGYSPGKQYDVKVVRLTEDESSSKVIDQVYLGSLRSIKLVDSVSQSFRTKVCVIGIRIKATDQFNGVIDQFNCVAESIVPDYWGTGTGRTAWINRPSSNPASLLLWILQGPMNPRPVADKLIDWPAIEKWHTWCQETNHTCNAVIDNQIVVKEILSQICSTGRASLTILDGKYSIIQDVEKTVPIQLFTPRNSWGFSGEKVFVDRPHALQISFIDEERGWQQNERIVYDDGYNADGSDGKLKATKFNKLTFWGVTKADQIWKDGRYQIAVCRLRPESFVVNCDIENLVCTRGDMVRIAHDVPLLGLYAGRIKQLIIENDSIISIMSDELIRMVEGKEYGIRIRKANGTIVVKPMITVHGETNIINFQTPLPLSENIQVGDLFSFGYNENETVEMIIIGIEARKDLTATMYLIPAAPGVHLADKGTIPAYNSAVSMPGDFSSQLQITSPASTAQPTVITAAQQAAQIGDIINQLQSIPTANELLYGNVKGDWTETPEKPTFECIPIGNSVVMKVIKQSNLSNFLHYAIRITKDQLNWYSLFMAGTGADWKDKPGEYTPWPGELFVHSKLPLAGTLEDPQPETYYYQVAIVTQKLDMSPWSDTVSVTVSPIQNGDIAFNFLAANNVLTGDLETLLLKAAYAIIGYRGTGTNESPCEGDRRAVLEGDEIRVGEELTGGVFSMLKGIRIGGAILGLFLSGIGCKYIYHPENPPNNIECFPNWNFEVFSFNNSYNNQYGVDNWAIKLRTTFSNEVINFFPYSLTAENEKQGGLSAVSKGINGKSQSAAIWFYFTLTGTPTTSIDLFAIGDGLNGFFVAMRYVSGHFYLSYVVRKNSGTAIGGITTLELMPDIRHYIALSYDCDTDVVNLVLDSNKYKTGVLGGTWGTGYFYFAIYVMHINSIYNTFFNEACFAYNQFIDPDLWIQHCNHGVPWNTKYSAADLVHRCKLGGKILFDTMQPVPAAGLPHFTGCKLVNVLTITSTPVEIDLSSFVSPGTTSVDLEVISNPTVGGFHGMISADNINIDSTFCNYAVGIYKTDHICTRLNSNRKFWMTAYSGTAVVDIRLVRFYI